MCVQDVMLVCGRRARACVLRVRLYRGLCACVLQFRLWAPPQVTHLRAGAGGRRAPMRACAAARAPNANRTNLGSKQPQAGRPPCCWRGVNPTQ